MEYRKIIDESEKIQGAKGILKNKKRKKYKKRGKLKNILKVGMGILKMD